MKLKQNAKNIEAGWLGLSAAILRQAAEEYIDALRERSSASKIKRLEKFFLSDWGQLLSRDQGEEIIRQCRHIAEERDNSSHKK